MCPSLKKMMISNDEHDAGCPQPLDTEYILMHNNAVVLSSI